MQLAHFRKAFFFNRSCGLPVTILIFLIEHSGSASAAHTARAAAAGWVDDPGASVASEIQTGSFGEPPTPSASDLTLALDQY